MKKIISIVLCALTLGLTTSAQSVNLRELKKDGSWLKKNEKAVKIVITAALASAVLGGGYYAYKNNTLGVTTKASDLWGKTKSLPGKIWSKGTTDANGDVTGRGYINRAWDKTSKLTCDAWNSSIKTIRENPKVSIAIGIAVSGVVALGVDRLIRKDNSLLSKVVDMIYNSLFETAEEAA